MRLRGKLLAILCLVAGCEADTIWNFSGLCRNGEVFEAHLPNQYDDTSIHEASFTDDFPGDCALIVPPEYTISIVKVNTNSDNSFPETQNECIERDERLVIASPMPPSSEFIVISCYAGDLNTHCGKEGCFPETEEFAPLVVKNDEDSDENYYVQIHMEEDSSFEFHITRHLHKEDDYEPDEFFNCDTVDYKQNTIISSDFFCDSIPHCRMEWDDDEGKFNDPNDEIPERCYGHFGGDGHTLYWGQTFGWICLFVVLMGFIMLTLERGLHIDVTTTMVLMPCSVFYTILIIGGIIGLFLADNISVYMAMLMSGLILLLLHWAFATRGRHVPPRARDPTGPM